jgi:nitrilase
MKTETIKVAIVQASPVHLNLKASIDKAIEYISEAAGQGARLIAFGETWLPGYPAWLDYSPKAALWNHAPTKEVFARLRENSLVVGSKDSERLSNAAKDFGVTLVMGINERVTKGEGQGTLYNSILTFDSDGRLINHHRKLVPTYTERLVWGQGDADGLKAVESNGASIGSLVCWEHWMPLTRQALHISGEQIHVAQWPGVHEMLQIASRHYAFEGRTFVLAAGSLMKVSDLPKELPIVDELKDKPDHFLLRGGSAIIAPDGKYIVEPVFDEEKILIADLDLRMIDKEIMSLDVTGHYSRPDLFEFEVKQNSRRN